MEMAHEKEMAMIQKEAAAAGHKGSVSEGDEISRVIRNSPLPLMKTLIPLMLISVLNAMPRIRAGEKIIMQFI